MGCQATLIAIKSHFRQLPLSVLWVPLQYSPLKTSYRGTGVSEVSERLSTGSWSTTTVHSHWVWCWLLWRVPLSVSSPDMVCEGYMSIFTERFQAGLADELGFTLRRVRIRVKGRWRMLVNSSTPVSMGFLWDKIHLSMRAMYLLVSTELDLPASRVSKRDKEHTSTSRDLQRYLCSWAERVLCVHCTSGLLPLPAQEEDETCLSVFVFYVSSVCGCCWRQHLVYATSDVNVHIHVSVCAHPVYVCLWDVFSASPLVEPAHRAAAALFLSLDRDNGFLGTPSWATTAPQERSRAGAAGGSCHP